MVLSRIDDLVEIEAIRQLKMRYCLGLDSKDWALYRSCFADGARLGGGVPGSDSGDPQLVGPDEWVASVAATVGTVKTLHTVHGSIVEIIGPDSARGLWQYTNAAGAGPAVTTPRSTSRRTAPGRSRRCGSRPSSPTRATTRRSARRKASRRSPPRGHHCRRRGSQLRNSLLPRRERGNASAGGVDAAAAGGAIGPVVGWYERDARRWHRHPRKVSTLSSCGTLGPSELHAGRSSGIERVIVNWR